MNAQPVRKFLVVEDNEGDARLLREMFREGGSNSRDVTRVSRMSEAEVHLAGHSVDVILLDLGLPDADGLGAVRRVRAAAPHVPLVVLTGMDDESLATRALQEGAQDYLVKGQIESRGLMRALRYSVERKAMEEALFAEKERALVTLNGIGDAVISTDVSGNVRFLNLVAERITGWSSQEASGRPMAEVLQILDAVTRERIPKTMGMTPSPERRVRPRSDGTLIRRDGTEIAIEDSIAPIRNRDGETIGAVIVFRDVGDRRRAEKEMRKSEERFRRLFDANTIGIAITDLSGRTLEANDAYLDMLGYTREEVLAGQFRWYTLTPPEFRERSELAMEELRKT